MKTLFIYFPSPSKLTWIAIASMITLSSCKTTITTSPTNTAVSTTEKKRPLRKKAKNIFKKKPGNAMDDFKKDLSAGRLKLKQHGAPGPVTPYYNEILKNDLGVKTEIIADGIIATDMLRYAKQYNALMTMEIERKYGPGILKQAFYRARVMEMQVRKGGEQQ